MSDNKNNKVVPLESDMKVYFWVVFGYANGLCPLRSFAEKGNKNSGFVPNTWIDADDDVLAKALTFANAANHRKAAFYVIPGTVSKVGQASSSDLSEMQVLLIDIDEGDTEDKLLAMTAVIGDPSMVVDSGGTTKEGYPKLHVYWKLEQAVSRNELKTLIDLRHKIALVFGGDTHFKSAHQPIRVAGSVYHKGGEAKLVKVRTYDPIEYSLEELAVRIDCLLMPDDKRSLEPIKDDKLPIDEIMTSKVHEGGNAEFGRFTNLQRIAGYWLRRCHEGRSTQEEVLEEIIAYNEANVVPPWPLEKLKPIIDALWKKHIAENGEPRKIEEKVDKKLPVIPSFSLRALLEDKSKLPEDIIAPRVLTPNGILVFGGAPKVGKSDFLMSLFIHMAAGKEFLGLIPPRPLRIFYFQVEVGYDYLRERAQKMQLTEELISMALDNLQITPNSKCRLNESGTEALALRIKEAFPDKPPDIIAVDPIRNVFDGGRSGATENENDAMMFFLQRRIEPLRDSVNPEAGIILAHHTRKMNKAQFDEDPFQAFSGASSLRSYYTSGALLYKPDPDSTDRHLIFELRNGGELPAKIINKQNGEWVEVDVLDKRIAHKKQSSLYDKERERRIKVIVRILEAEALKKRFYLMKQFAEKFQNYKDLGGRRGIYDDCSAAATQGIIKFFDNPESYGLPLITDLRKGFGFMCTADMEIANSITLPETGEVRQCFIQIQPTHYKRDGDGAKIRIIGDTATTMNFKEVTND